MFRVLADGWAYAGWAVGVTAIRDVDDQWPQPGAQIHHSVGAWPLLIDESTCVLAAEPPRRLVLRAPAWPLDEARVIVELFPLEDGNCLVRLSEDASPGLGLFLPYPVRRLGLSPRNRECLRRLDSLSCRYHP